MALKIKERKEKLSPSFGINTSKYVSKVKEATISFVTRKKQTQYWISSLMSVTKLKK